MKLLSYFVFTVLAGTVCLHAQAVEGTLLDLARIKQGVRAVGFL